MRNVGLRFIRSASANDPAVKLPRYMHVARNKDASRVHLEAFLCLGVPQAYRTRKRASWRAQDGLCRRVRARFNWSWNPALAARSAAMTVG